MRLRGPEVARVRIRSLAREGREPYARTVSTDEAVAEIGRRVPMEQVEEDGAPAPGAAPGSS